MFCVVSSTGADPLTVTVSPIDADGELDPQVGRSGRFDDDLLVLRGREAAEGDGDGVAAGVQVGELEDAPFVGDGFLGLTGALVLELDGGAGDDGVGRVGDGTGDAAGDAHLGAGGGRSEDGCEQGQQQHASGLGHVATPPRDGRGGGRTGL